MITAAYWIRVFLIVALPLLSPTQVTFAQDIKAPFLFTEDEKLAQTDLEEAVPKSDALGDDPYLNAPMTRLEYMLTMLDAYLNGDSLKSSVKDLVAANFESGRVQMYEPSLSITGSARYSIDTGRILLGYNIAHLGRPKLAMRHACDTLLSRLETWAPQTNLGYFYYNTVLGVLDQTTNRTKYAPILETFSKSIVYRVVLISQTSKATNTLICQRTGLEAAVQYHRYSYKLPDTKEDHP